ncbi:MAG: acetylxylan esterase, partial [Tunicatimonas sp.]
MRIFFILIIATLSAIAALAQGNMLCQGYHWTEDEGNRMMKQFATEWSDSTSWEARASRIRQGILEGMQYDKMPKISGNFDAIINGTREMDGYIVENIAIRSFPGFYITGNLYRPAEKQEKYAAILSPHGHLKDNRFTH